MSVPSWKIVAPVAKVLSKTVLVPPWLMVKSLLEPSARTIESLKVSVPLVKASEVLLRKKERESILSKVSVSRPPPVPWVVQVGAPAPP